MQLKIRTNTIESLSSLQQEAVANLDPLTQSISDQDDEPIYLHRQSSIFYIPVNSNDENDNNQHNRIQKYFIYIERFSGILYALLGSFLSTLSNFLLKQFNVNILDVLFIRCLVHTLISLCFIFYKGYYLFPNDYRILILIRSIFAATGSITFFYCLTLLPLSDLSTLRYTQVIWTALLAMIIFHERLRLPTIFACILTLCGVICVAQPTFLFSHSKFFNETFLITTNTLNNHQQFIGIFIGLSCALTISLSTVLNKKLVQKKVRQSLIMFYFLCTTFIILIIIRMNIWIFSKSNNQLSNILTKDFLFASIIIISQLIPIICTQKAIKREHPSIITVVQSSDIIFALIFQYIFTNITTNLVALIGSMLVLTSIFIIGGHKLWLDRQDHQCLPVPIENKP